MKDVYVDRFVKFNISQGVARLDFARLEDIDAEKKGNAALTVSALGYAIR